MHSPRRETAHREAQLASAPVSINARDARRLFEAKCKDLGAPTLPTATACRCMPLPACHWPSAPV